MKCWPWEMPQFQKKCLGKMDEVANGGRTVLFVSHQMNALSSFCSRCLLLKQGKLAASGLPSEIINQYLNKECRNLEWKASADENCGNSYFRPLAVLLLSMRVLCPSPGMFKPERRSGF